MNSSVSVHFPLFSERERESPYVYLKFTACTVAQVKLPESVAVCGKGAQAERNTGDETAKCKQSPPLSQRQCVYVSVYGRQLGVC